MEDPYGFIIPLCNYSSSQEDHFNNCFFAGEGDTPVPSPPPPSTAVDANGIIDCPDSDDDDDVNAIFICSAPETQLSDSGDEFQTPPEESRRSSSEEAPPQMSSLHDYCGNKTVAVETDGGDLDGETPDLGFSQDSEMVEMLSHRENQVKEVSEVDFESVSAREKRIPVEEPSHSSISASVDTLLSLNTHPDPITREDGESSEEKIIELPIETDVLSDGHAPAAEVCNVDHKSSRVEENRGPVEESSPSKIIRASVDSAVPVKTPPNLATGDEGDCSEEMEIDCPVETEVKEDMNMETEVYFVDSGDTVVLDEDYGEGNVNQTNNVEFSDVQQVVQDEEEVLEDENATDSVEFSDVQQEQEEDEGVENENETDSVEFSDVQQVEEEDEGLENETSILDFSGVQQVQEEDEGLENVIQTNNADLSDVQQVQDEGEVLKNENETNNVEVSGVQQVQGLKNENEINNIDFSDVQKVQEKEGFENANESKQHAVDDAEDLGRQGMRELPLWAFQHGDRGKGEVEEDDNLEESMALILELLDLLAEEELRDRNQNHGTGDFLETAKLRGMNFPEPKWWHDAGDNCGGST